jgi:hypothetical protein
MKKKGNELLYSSFFVLKLSIVAFRPQAPHKTTRTIANSNRRYNSIDSLLICGRLSSNQAEINKHISQFYQKLFTK